VCASRSLNPWFSFPGTTNLKPFQFSCGNPQLFWHQFTSLLTTLYLHSLTYSMAMSFILFRIFMPTSYYAGPTSKKNKNSSPTPAKPSDILSRLDSLPKIRRFKAERTARDNLAVNMRNCTFYQLPQELIDIIVQHLGTSDMLSLAASCRLCLSSQQGRTHTPAPTESNKQEFTLRLQRDRRSRMIAVEQGVHPARRKTLFCDLCVEQHPPLDFTASQLLAATQSRKCIAASLVFLVCKYCSLTFLELRELSKNENGNKRDWPCCQHPDHGLSDQPRFDSPYPPRRRSSGIFAFHVISTLAPNQPVKASQIS
jgi:hypothetical protein